MKKKVTIAVLSALTIALMRCCLMYANSNPGKWYYWLEPNVYATYTFPSEEPQEIPGWWHEGASMFNLIQLSNGTRIGFNNLTIGWRVLEVRESEDRALVEYVFVLLDAALVRFEPAGLKPVSSLGELSLSTEMWVELDTLDVYDGNGSYVGRFPFWIRSYEVGTNITMVHDVLQYNIAEKAYIAGNFTMTLVDLSRKIEQYEIANAESVGILTPSGFFSMRRLISGAPCWKKIIYDNMTIFASQSFLPALYDKFSLVMLGFGGVYVDDVLLHLLGEIEGGVHLTKSLVIGSSNIDFSQHEEPESNEGPSLLLLIALSLAIVTVGCTIYVRNRKRL